MSSECRLSRNQTTHLIKQKLSQGDYHSAIAALEVLVKRDKQENTLNFRELLASCYEKVNDYEKALNCGLLVIKERPNDPHGYLRAGKNYQLLRQDEAAVEMYKKGLQNTKRKSTPALTEIMKSQLDQIQSRITKKKASSAHETSQRSNTEVNQVLPAQKRQRTRTRTRSGTESNAPAPATDMVKILPFEIIDMILEYLPLQSIVVLLRVCKSWNREFTNYALAWTDLSLKDMKFKGFLTPKILRTLLHRSNGRVRKVSFPAIKKSDMRDLSTILFQGISGNKLQELYLDGLPIRPLVSDPYLTQLRFQNLRILRTSSSEWKEVLQALMFGQLPALEVLYLYRVRERHSFIMQSRVSDNALDMRNWKNYLWKLEYPPDRVKRHTRLKNLVLDGARGKDAAQLIHLPTDFEDVVLANLTELQVLSLVQVGIPPQSPKGSPMFLYKSVPNLIHLDLAYSYYATPLVPATCRRISLASSVGTSSLPRVHPTISSISNAVQEDGMVDSPRPNNNFNIPLIPHEYSNIETLDLAFCRTLKPQILTRFVDRLLEGQSLTKLISLDLTCCPNLSSSELSLLPIFRHLVSSSPHLQFMSVAGNYWFTDEFLGELAQLPCLRTLDLSDCRALTARGILIYLISSTGRSLPPRIPSTRELSLLLRSSWTSSATPSRHIHKLYLYHQSAVSVDMVQWLQRNLSPLSIFHSPGVHNLDDDFLMYLSRRDAGLDNDTSHITTYSLY
ncbi:uncharacterized protein V1516DRAFT_675351 [Lipomyces oligophaga]|uniref:uncharacterized protein n=1 Tax=Lipomyces oligophaga TaxID=45792 RepID=UPI0034CFA9E4